MDTTVDKESSTPLEKDDDDSMKIISIIHATDDNDLNNNEIPNEEEEEEIIRNETRQKSSITGGGGGENGNLLLQPILKSNNSPSILIVENNSTIPHSASSPDIFYPKKQEQVVYTNNFHHHQVIFDPNPPTIFNHQSKNTTPSISIELQEDSSEIPSRPLHQLTNPQSTRNYSTINAADNSLFSSTNLQSSTNLSTPVNYNSNVGTKPTLKQRAFSNVKLISPRKRLKQSPSISSIQSTSESWGITKENRKELEQLFKRKGYPKGTFRGCCFEFWTVMYNIICPINRISNILLFVVILHTLVCIVATSIILYAGGEQSVQETTRLNNMNLVQEMVQYLDVATKSSSELSMLFTVQSKYYNDTKGNGSFVEPITRFSTTVAPKLYTYSNALAMVYYGNDNGDFAFAERRRSGPFLYISQSIFLSQFSELFKNQTVPTSNNIYVFKTNDYFEPYLPRSNNEFRTLHNSTYDPRERPWYISTKSQTEKGNPVWSDVFVDVNGNLSIAASLVMENLNSIRPSYKEVVGVHLVFDKIQSYLLELYSFTNNLMILMENNGNLLTSNEDSFPIIYSNYSRVNISQFTSANTFSTKEKSFWGLSDAKLDLIERIANVMVSNNLLDKRYNGSIPCKTETFQVTQFGDVPDKFCILNRYVTIKQYNTSTSFVSVSRLVDECGMDFYFIVSRTYYSFADVLIDHYVGLLVVLAVTVLIGTLIVLALTSCISYSLFFVSRKLFYISRLRQEKQEKNMGYTMQRAFNKIFFEIDTLQKCLDSVERANSSFIKYIPRSVVKFIVEGSTSAKLGMVNAEITIVFTDLANFTSISEALSIHNLLLVISRYFEVVTSNVQEYGGIIDKYIGDGCMALFNTPYQPVSNHSEHACKAAIKIVKGLKKLNKEMEEVYKMKIPTEISARIGINTGSALIGNIGTHDRLNFTAVGDSVNISSRLESLNRMYGTKILVGEGSVSTFRGIEKLRGETKDFFSTMIDQNEFSLSDLAQRMMNVVESQVSTPRSLEKTFPRESNAQSSIDMGKEMRFSISSNNPKATSTSTSQDNTLPHVVIYFIDTICLKGKNQPVPVFAVQCERKFATIEQIYIEKMLDLVRRELLEEKRMKDVIHLLRCLLNYFVENQLTDSPVFREHNSDHYAFKFGEDIQLTINNNRENDKTKEEEVSTIIEGDPYPVIYKAITKLKDRLEVTLMEHETRKRKAISTKRHHLLSALSVPLIETRSKSDPLIHPTVIPDFSTNSLLDMENNDQQQRSLDPSESTPLPSAKFEYYRQMALLEKENRRTSMKLNDFSLRLHEK